MILSLTSRGSVYLGGGGEEGGLGARGGGGALSLVLGTHCKTDSRSCGCRLEKRGLSYRPKNMVCLVQGKHPGLAVINVLATGIRVIVSGQLKMMSTGGKPR